MLLTFTPRIEPGTKVCQSSALPLDNAAFLFLVQAWCTVPKYCSYWSCWHSSIAHSLARGSRPKTFRAWCGKAHQLLTMTWVNLKLFDISLSLCVTQK